MTTATTYLSEICRFYIVALFLFAAMGKILAFGDFEKTISDGVNIPPRFGRHVASIVIIGESLAALLSSMRGEWGECGVALALFLSLVFTGFVATMLVQGRLIRCSCFGEADDRITALDLVRNGVLMTACAFFLFNAPSDNSISVVTLIPLLAMAIIALLVSVNLKGIASVLRLE
jgi:hypothetical protein